MTVKKIGKDAFKRFVDNLIKEKNIFGPCAKDDRFEFEQEIISAHTELLEGLQKHRVDAARRPLLVRLADAQLTVLDEHRVRLSFSLPTGSFATSVLRELIASPATELTATTGHESYDEVISE